MPKIADFGLARKLDEPSRTQSGAVMGTPSYMAPEQARGQRDLTPAVDIWALGGILYECLTGRVPFRGITTMETLLQVMAADVVGVRQLSPSVPRDLETICHKCLQKDPARRYASAQALADDLDRFLKGEPILARPVGSIERTVKWVRRYPVVSALVATVILVVAVGVAASWTLTAWALHEKQLAQHQETEAQRQRDIAQENLLRAQWLVYAGKLSLAESAFAEGHVGQARQHLEECQWDLRGWEHHRLWTRYTSRQNLEGHTQAVSSVAWSPDGKLLLSGSGEFGVMGEVKVWDAETGRERHTLKDGRYPVAWSPSGRRILTGTRGHMAKVWGLQTGEEILSLEGHAGEVCSLAFSPDGKRIATGSHDRSVRIWDAETGRVYRVLADHNESVVGLAWSPDGRKLITGTRSLLQPGQVKIWDVEKGEVFRDVGGAAGAVAWSPDGRRIAASEVESSGKTVRVYDANTGEVVGSLSGHTNSVGAITWSDDGQLIATGSWDQSARIWDAQTRREIHNLRGHIDSVGAVAWSPDARRLVTGSWDRSVQVWDAAQGQQGRKIPGVRAPLAGSPDGRFLLGAGDNHTARIWDANTGMQVGVLAGHDRFIESVAWSPEGERILTGSADRTARIWNARSGQAIRTFSGHGETVGGVAWHPDGKRILTGSDDFTAKVWDAGSGKELLSLEGHTRSVSSVAFSGDGQRILTGSRDETARIWDAADGKVLFTLRGHASAVNAVAWGPGDRTVLTGSSDKTLRLWEMATGKDLRVLRGHTEGVLSVAWSADGRRILTGGEDKTVRVWDAVRGQELLTLKDHPDTAVSVGWGPGDREVWAGGYSGATVWNATRAQSIHRLTGTTQTVAALAFEPKSRRLFAWDAAGKVLAWSTETGLPADADDPPVDGDRGPITSPDGTLEARGKGTFVEFTDRRWMDPEANRWPLPDVAERKRYHSEQAALAEKSGRWFAAVFHLGRWLLEDPENAELKNRRDAAMMKHRAAP